MEQTVFFHVAPATYAVGDDLWCYNELQERGYAPVWKWEGDADEGYDGDVVCMFRTLEEAQDFLKYCLPSGQILRIDLTNADNIRGEGVLMTTVDEGFPAVMRRIPAEYITVAE